LHNIIYSKIYLKNHGLPIKTSDKLLNRGVSFISIDRKEMIICTEQET
jgi:hypothetical protein